jgi:hypothetical protein
LTANLQFERHPAPAPPQLLGAFQFERGSPDSDGRGADLQKRLAIKLEHFGSPLRLVSATLKPSNSVREDPS